MEKYYIRDGKYYYNDLEMKKSTWYRDRRNYVESLKKIEKVETQEKKETKVQKIKSNKSNLTDDINSYLAKTIIDALKDEIVISHKLDNYKNAYGNLSYRLTKRCLNYVKHNKNVVEVVLKNKKKERM